MTIAELLELNIASTDYFLSMNTIFKYVQYKPPFAKLHKNS